MNATIENFARRQILEQGSSLPAEWQRTFKLMYGRNGGKRSVEDTCNMPFDKVVNEMPADKLDWALQPN